MKTETLALITAIEANLNLFNSLNPHYILTIDDVCKIMKEKEKKELEGLQGKDEEFEDLPF
jgi:hypothetical protein